MPERDPQTLVFQGKMRAAGQLAARVLDEVGDLVKPGVTTQELNDFCHRQIIEAGAEPAPLNYRGFPKSICTSVNEVACHGVPKESEVLRDGDIIKIDVSVNLDGYYGDSCRTYFVGTPTERTKKIAQVAYNAMASGINMVKPGNTTDHIGSAIEASLKGTGYSALRHLFGHGVGHRLHLFPRIRSYGAGASRTMWDTETLREGMIFTIEPVIVEGNDTYSRNKDNADTVEPGRLSAQFEHTVLVTGNGCEILTESPKRMYLPASIKNQVVALHTTHSREHYGRRP